MEKRKLNEFVTFVQGINPTRAEKQFGVQTINYYDQSSFEIDYNHDDGFAEEGTKTLPETDISLVEGDVVISNSLQLATIVGKNNVGKVLSLNFTKVSFKNEQLDKRYFIYLFNEYKDIKRQKGRELQGSGAILRIPLKSLEEIRIPMVDIEEQKRIGAIYTETRKLQNKINRYAGLLEQFTNVILEESLKEKWDK